MRCFTVQCTASFVNNKCANSNSTNSSYSGILARQLAAQRKYDEVQKQRQLDRVMKKAEKTHKERVEDFNRHLDGLSEHYDIPKVSWTK